MEAGFQYPELPGAEQAAWQRETVECISDYIRDDIRGSGPLGWKMGVTLFMMPMVLDAFPQARVIHLIRDGRDLMLSRLDARMDFSSRLNRRLVFGDPDTDRWRGRPLTAETVASHRNEIEMQHRVTAVEFGLGCRAYGDRYLEVNAPALPGLQHLRQDLDEVTGHADRSDHEGRHDAHHPPGLPVHLGAQPPFHFAHVDPERGHVGLDVGFELGNIGLQLGHVGLELGNIGLQLGHVGFESNYVQLESGYVGFDFNYVGF